MIDASIEMSSPKNRRRNNRSLSGSRTSLYRSNDRLIDQLISYAIFRLNYILGWRRRVAAPADPIRSAITSSIEAAIGVPSQRPSRSKVNRNQLCWNHQALKKNIFHLPRMNFRERRQERKSLGKVLRVQAKRLFRVMNRKELLDSGKLTLIIVGVINLFVCLQEEKSVEINEQYV